MEHKTALHRIASSFADELQLAAEHMDHLHQENDALNEENNRLLKVNAELEEQLQALGQRCDFIAQRCGFLEKMDEDRNILVQRTAKALWPTLDDVSPDAIPEAVARQIERRKNAEDEAIELADLVTKYRRAARKALGTRSYSDERIIAALAKLRA